MPRPVDVEGPGAGGIRVEVPEEVWVEVWMSQRLVADALSSVLASGGDSQSGIPIVMKSRCLADGRKLMCDEVEECAEGKPAYAKKGRERNNNIKPTSQENN